MKKLLLLIACLLTIAFSNSYGVTMIPEENNNPDDSLYIWTTPGLYNLTRTWADEYSILNPGIRITVKELGENGEEINAARGFSFGIVSEDSYMLKKEESDWRMVVAREVIVPVINASNPFIAYINQHGVSPELLGQALGSHGNQVWGTLLGNEAGSSMNYYGIKDKDISSSVSAFLAVERINANQKETGGPAEMIGRIGSDPLAFGFCRLTDIIDSKGQNLIEGIKIMPIDINGNGRVDYFENIYENLNSVTRGVWIGKYPRSLVSNLFAVSPSGPDNKNETSFLRWVLTDGQVYLNSAGYSELVLNERQSKMDKLIDNSVTVSSVTDESNVTRVILLLVAIFVLSGSAGGLVVRYVRKRRATVVGVGTFSKSMINENSFGAPGGLYYDKTHTWAYLEKDGKVRIGIDDFLQRVTGEVTRVIMKNPGEKINRGERALTIVQKGKQMIIYSPVSGTISEKNSDLHEESSLINSSPFSEGWVYTITPDNWSKEIGHMTMAQKYTQWLKDEFARLRDFLAHSLGSGKEGIPAVVLQDGGEIADNVLMDLSPEVWEDFQTKFLDPSK